MSAQAPWLDAPEVKPDEPWMAAPKVDSEKPWEAAPLADTTPPTQPREVTAKEAAPSTDATPPAHPHYQSVRELMLSPSIVPPNYSHQELQNALAGTSDATQIEPPPGVNVLTGKPALPGGFVEPSRTGTPGTAVEGIDTPIVNVSPAVADAFLNNFAATAPAYQLLKTVSPERASGVAEGAAGFASDMTTGQNVAMMTALAGAPAIVEKLVAAGFSLQAAHGAYEQSKELLNERDPTKQASLATNILLNGALATFGAFGAVKGLKGGAAEAPHEALAQHVEASGAPQTAEALRETPAPQTPVEAPKEAAAPIEQPAPETQPAPAVEAPSLASVRETAFNQAHPETNTEPDATHYAAAVASAEENHGAQFYKNGEPSAFVVRSMEDGRPAWKLVEPTAKAVRGHDGELHAPEIGFDTPQEAIASALKRGFEVDPEALSDYEKTRGQTASGTSGQPSQEGQAPASQEQGAALQASETGGARQAGKPVRISIPDSPTGVPDLIDFVKEQGGIKLPPKGKRTQEHDDVSEETERFYNGKLANPRGSIHADEMAQMAYDAGLTKDPSVSEFWKALHENIVGRPRTREMARQMQRKMVEAEKEDRKNAALPKLRAGENQGDSPISSYRTSNFEGENPKPFEDLVREIGLRQGDVIVHSGAEIKNLNSPLFAERKGARSFYEEGDKQTVLRVRGSAVIHHVDTTRLTGLRNKGVGVANPAVNYLRDLGIDVSKMKIKEAETRAVIEARRRGIDVLSGIHRSINRAENNEVFIVNPDAVEILPKKSLVTVATLRSGEKGTGEMFQGKDQPFNLAGEKGTDFAKREAERIAAEKASAEAKALQDKQQAKLFEKPAETKPPVTREQAHEQAYNLAQSLGEQVAKGQPDTVKEAAVIAAYENARGSIENGGAFNPEYMRKSAMSAAGKEAAKLGTSLDAPQGEEGSATLGESIPSGEKTPSEATEKSDAYNHVNDWVSKLDTKQQGVVRARMNGKTFEEIAADSGVTRQAAKQSFDRAVNKLREMAKASGVDQGVLHLQIIPGAHEFIKQDVARVIGDGFKGVQKAIRQIAEILAPPTRSIEAKRMAGNIRSNAAEMAHKYEIAQKQLRNASKIFNRTSNVFNLGVIDDMEAGRTMATPALQSFASAVRSALDARVQEVRALNPNALQHVIQDYFPHIWTKESVAKLQGNPNPVAGNAWAAAFGKRPMEGGKSFLKQRSIPTTADGIAAGLEPVTYNPVELALLKIREMDRYIMGQKVIQEMKGAGQLKFVRPGERPDPGYSKIDDRFAKVIAPRDWTVTDAAGNKMPGQIVLGEYYAPDDVARVLNNYLSPGLRGNAVFDATRWIGNLMNQAQLGFSLYHGTFTTIDALTSSLSLGIEQIARGDPLKGIANVTKAIAGAPVGYGAFENFFRGNKVLKEYVKPGSIGGDMAKVVDALVSGGGRIRMDTFYKTGAFNSMMNAIRSGNYPGAALRAPFALVEALSKPLMEYVVPRMKLGIFADMARYELSKLSPSATANEARAVMGRVWNSVDNRMGQLVYDNLFWNHVLKDGLMAGVRSVGWNLGTISEVGGGITDAAGSPIRAAKQLAGNLRGEDKPVFTHKMAYVVALPVMTAWIGGMYQYLMTGKPPDDVKDLFMPRTGRTKEDGSPERVMFPTYMKDIAPLAVAGKRGVVPLLSRTAQMAINKMHPVLSSMSQMWQNKDYYGNQIRNADDGLVDTAKKEALFVARQFESFSVRGAQQREGGAKEKAQTFFGVMPVPEELTRTPAMQRINDYFASHSPAGGRDESEQVKKETLTNIVHEIHSGADKDQVLGRAYSRGDITRKQSAALRTRLRQDPRTYAFNKLPAEEAAKVFDLGTKEEKSLWRSTLDMKKRRAGR